MNGGYWVPGRWNYAGYGRDRYAGRDFYRGRGWDREPYRGRR
jgi:hypothetical protein